MAGVSINKESPWVLFGLDLTRLVSVFQTGVQQLLWDPVGGVRSRVEAPISVRGGALTEPRAYCDWGVSDAPLSACAWHALLLDDAVVLERELVLPSSLENEVSGIVGLEVDAHSPFSPEERLAGWRIVARDNSTITVCIAITARGAVERLLGEQAFANHGSAPEVWHLSSTGLPIVIPGFGETAREDAYRRALRGIALRTTAVVIIVLLMAVIPVIAASLRAQRAENLMADVLSEAAEEMRLRDQVAQSNNVLEELAQDVANASDPRAALHRLAAATPDAVFLSRLDLQGTNLRLSGFASDAASYMQQLSAVDWLDDVAAPTAFQRNPRTGLERFLLDTTLAVPTSGDSDENPEGSGT